MAHYRISNLAQADLEDIWHYTIQEWSLHQARKYLDDLLQCFEHIATGKTIGKTADYISNGYKKALCGRHYVFYKTSKTDGMTEIIRVLHTRMDIENKF